MALRVSLVRSGGVVHGIGCFIQITRDSSSDQEENEVFHDGWQIILLPMLFFAMLLIYVWKPDQAPSRESKYNIRIRGVLINI